ncbi:ubiquitin ligase protein BRE1 [Xylaria bambusicola]|uniref:ubiquitin ligase protein BRE1 n=1 Tax=Xylaria bambusicola TaxID=326684 RepID=UPI002007A0D6|nr:ubiquitin ligase protein BRE1 [Xylaria bambusicola]KAI0527903.1 ubiquitin ligase protein BRE1 [Xylaria bambusicola]
MPSSTSPTVAPLSTRVKMEDRKRPAVNSTDDIAPPSKRQAVNGSSKTKDDPDTKDEVWVEEYQKDAIYRQMLEYKREKTTLEARLEELDKRSTFHDDHIRVMDGWWTQLLQEISLLVNGTIDFSGESEEQPFPTRTQFKDNEEFELHLDEKATKIKSILGTLFSQLSSNRGKITPNVTNLESQVNNLLASQKDLILKVDRLTSDKDSLSEQLNNATLRYMKAERRLDRVKSAQVQKLEQQALANSTTRSSAGADQTNGTNPDESNGNYASQQLALQELKAVGEKQKEQLEAAVVQNKSLQTDLTSLQTRLTNLTDEDYSRTEIFKLFKAQNEDLIKKTNNLEAECHTLRQENAKLEKEREANRQRFESEAQNLISDLEEQLQQADTNLARVRAARDELHADVMTLKANKEQERTALDHMRDLISAKEDRISVLENEVKRLQPGEDVEMTAPSEIDELSLDELREKYKKLRRDYESIDSELPGMTSALKKYQALANKKVMDFAAQEERVALSIAEKSKADQKYFNARKESDTKADEVKRLRSQNMKSSEIISQLKEVEAQNRTLVANLDKQLADMKQTNTSVMAENKKLETTNQDTSRRYDSLKQQVSELTNLAKTKDSTASTTKERNIHLETEVEKLKVRLESTTKDRDKWKTKSLSNSSEEEEMLRNMATCSICKKDFKNTIIRGCGHIFCRGCVDDRLANRMRKCPNCNKAFDKNDIMTIHL